MNGVIRNIDEVGRIVLPKDMRQNHDMQDGDSISIISTADGILLTKYAATCIFCCNIKNLGYYKNKAVCIECIASLRKD